MELVLSQVVLVIESVEISSFTLVWELRRIANHISSIMIPSMIVVSVHTFLVINSMNENIVIFFSMLELLKSWNMLS